MTKYDIIIVENDADEQFFMKEGFDESGLFNIISQVKNGDTLFHWLSENAQLPHVILSDINMPGKNGYDILEEIRSTPRLAHIPVVVTSTSSVQSVIDRCMALGAAGFLVKPETFVDYQPFAQNLHSLIQQKQLVK